MPSANVRRWGTGSQPPGLAIAGGVAVLLACLALPAERLFSGPILTLKGIWGSVTTRWPARALRCRWSPAIFFFAA
jgi:hypothetical protein